MDGMPEPYQIVIKVQLDGNAWGAQRFASKHCFFRVCDQFDCARTCNMAASEHRLYLPHTIADVVAVPDLSSH